MRKWLVFEGGSRAGLSTMIFFDKYKKATRAEDILYLADNDKNVSGLSTQIADCFYCSDLFAMQLLNDKEVCLFPADELARQINEDISKFASKFPITKVYSWYYDKKKVNEYLSERIKSFQSDIYIPKTIEYSEVCIRPNTRSAGSRGVQLLNNTCVTPKIDINKEFVADVFRDNFDIKVMCRQVIIKNGYDRFVKLLNPKNPILEKIKNFIVGVCPTNDGIFSNIFHIQFVEDKDGFLWYIESSKRISGTSLVFVKKGFNPFLMQAGQIEKLIYDDSILYDEWYRYEDFVYMN